LLAAPAPLPIATPAEEAQAVHWLRDQGHRLSSASPSGSELVSLVDRLRGANVIGIGEATHGDHEDQAFKAELIKALVRDGMIDTLVLEANRRTGVALDAYVRRSVGDPTDAIQNHGLYRAWRDDEFAGLILWLRDWNAHTAKPVAVIAVDMQDGFNDALAALDFVRERDPALAGRLEPPLAIYRDQNFGEWASRKGQAEAFKAAQQAANAVDAAFTEHRADWSSDTGYHEAAYAARVARQGFYMFELEGGRAPEAALDAAYYGRRDQLMGANLLDRLGTGTAAFWAHNDHVLGQLGEQPEYRDYNSIGQVLRRKLGARYVTVLASWGRGAFSAETSALGAGAEIKHQPPTEHRLPNDGPGTLGRLLGMASQQPFWIDLRTLPQTSWATSFGRAHYLWGHAGWAIDPATWNKDPTDPLPLRPGADILVFFPVITPAHFWVAPLKRQP
jgi:erythromycin esterase